MKIQAGYWFNSEGSQRTRTANSRTIGPKKKGKKRSFNSKVETDYGNNIKLQTLQEVVEKGIDGSVKINLEL